MLLEIFRSFEADIVYCPEKFIKSNYITTSTNFNQPERNVDTTMAKCCPNILSPQFETVQNKLYPMFTVPVHSFYMQ